MLCDCKGSKKCVGDRSCFMARSNGIVEFGRTPGMLHLYLKLDAIVELLTRKGEWVRVIDIENTGENEVIKLRHGGTVYLTPGHVLELGGKAVSDAEPDYSGFQRTYDFVTENGDFVMAGAGVFIATSKRKQTCPIKEPVQNV